MVGGLQHEFITIMGFIAAVNKGFAMMFLSPKTVDFSGISQGPGGHIVFKAVYLPGVDILSHGYSVGQ